MKYWRLVMKITDEVLAVGDESFQLKCLDWINGYIKNGGTLLLVSHSVYHVQKLCKKAVWLEKGQIKQMGDVFEVSQAYQDSIVSPNQMASGDQVNRLSYHLYDAEIRVDDQAVEEITLGQTITLIIKVYTPDNKIPGICIGVVNHVGLPIYGTYSELYETHPVLDDKGIITYEVTMPALKLLPGTYEFRFHTMTPDNIQMIDTFEKKLKVKGRTRELGSTQLTTEWK